MANVYTPPPVHVSLLPREPVVIDDVCTPAQLASAARRILELRQACPESAKGANLGGWKSPYEIFDQSADLTRIGAAIRAQLKLRWKIAQCPINWAMINSAGSSHPRHRHGSAGISCVLYVTAGDPPVPTVVELEDPVGGELAVAPIPGRMLVMPMRLWHRVPVYAGASPRITIAFDAFEGIRV